MTSHESVVKHVFLFGSFNKINYRRQIIREEKIRLIEVKRYIFNSERSPRRNIDFIENRISKFFFENYHALQSKSVFFFCKRLVIKKIVMANIIKEHSYLKSYDLRPLLTFLHVVTSLHDNPSQWSHVTLFSIDISGNTIFEFHQLFFNPFSYR